MNTGGEFLIVEDEEPVAAWLSRSFARFRPVHQVSTVAAALEAIADASRKWVALVTDIGLPDGSGLDVIRAARTAWPELPVLVLTGSPAPRVVNGSFLLGASFLSKPTSTESLETFARRALSGLGGEDFRVIHVLDVAAREWSLSEREVALLRCAIADSSRRDLASALGIAENTAKTHIRSLLKKSGARSVDHVVHKLLRRALEHKTE